MSARPSATATAQVLAVIGLVVGLGAVERSCAAPRVAPDSSPTRAPEPAHTAASDEQPPCPTDSLLDDGVCVPVPMEAPVERSGNAATLELLPGRARDFASYQTPIRSASAAPTEPAPAVFIAAPVGTVVEALALEAQLGPARRVLLADNGLVTLHHVERGGAARTYALLYEGMTLDPTPRAELHPGARLGEVAASPKISPGLKLRVRQVRQGIEASNTPPERLLRDSHSVECDPRNVLPPRPPA